MVWSHVAVTEAPSTVSELPEKSMSSVSEPDGMTPCSLATLPVCAVCWSDGHSPTVLPLLLTVNHGAAGPLVIRLSENSWLAGAAEPTSKSSSKKRTPSFYCRCKGL